MFIMEISSRIVVEGTARAPHRAMYKAMGLTDDDLSKPFVGVCHTGNEATPCNIHLPGLAQKAKDGVKDAGATPREFSTIAVSDGIAMGHEGMKSSLVSREVIADSIELMVRAHQYDALVGIAGCDKSLPGTMMAMARLNIPSVFVYGGTIMPGMLDGKELTVVDVYEAVGSYDAGKISLEELKNIENTACPNAGSCGGMFTANTMASISEAIGIALPGSASPPAEDDRREKIVYETGKACTELLAQNIKPRDILTFESFENAITMLNAVGGSTNGILHLLALANEVGIKLTYDDFERIRKKTPHIADMKPGGGYVMNSLDKIGGIPLIMKKLLDNNLIHGNALTVTGKTIEENIKQYKVSTSEILKIERLNNQEGKTVEFKNVLFLNDDKTTEIGNPNIQGAKVEATILKNTKNKTILVFKKRRRKNSRKKYGHRQPISLIRITKIFSKNGKLISQAGPQKQITKEIVKADQARKEQMFEAKKTKIEEHKKIKKTLKKIEAKEGSARMLKADETRKLQKKAAKQYDEQEKKRLELVQAKLKLAEKKSGLTKKKTVNKKKPLTTKKK